MTETAGRVGLFALRLLPVAAAAAIVAGCSTTNLEDVAPVASMQAPQTLPEKMPPPASASSAAAPETVATEPAPPPVTVAAQPEVAAPPVRDAIDTGSFPNLNVPPGTAAPQFTPSEKAAKLAELGSKRTITQSGPATNPAVEAAKVKRLRLLAQTHAADTLKAIEAE